MKGDVRSILSGTAAFVLLATLVAVFIKGNGRNAVVTCNGIELTIEDSAKTAFICKADIEKILKEEYKDYRSLGIQEIDVRHIEEILNKKTSVSNSEVYFTGNGILHVYVSQFVPVVKFIKGSTGFYADKGGVIFPLQKVDKPGLPEVKGDIPVNFKEGYKGQAGTKAEQSWIKGALELVKFIQKDNVWKKNIRDITVRSGGDIVLIPRVGKEKFIFGQPSGFREKFDKIEKYYTHIVPAKGQDAYSSVNVKFEGQIICRK